MTIFYYVLDLNVDGPEKNELLQMFIYGPQRMFFFVDVSVIFIGVEDNMSDAHKWDGLSLHVWLFFIMF